MLNEIRKTVKNKNPLIHCITNPISINQCANAILCIGARPIMAEHPKEVDVITKTANALMLNLGNITDIRISSMEISRKISDENHIPILLDAVGVACSPLRRNFAKKLLRDGGITVVKGNYSEIVALYEDTYNASGIDADQTLNARMVCDVAVSLAKSSKTIVLASGKMDIITDGNRIVYVHNGSHLLSRVTGTGCMLGAICATMLSVDTSIYAVVTACAMLGIAGELAYTSKGMGTFMVNLMDHLSIMEDDEMNRLLKIEEIDLNEESRL